MAKTSTTVERSFSETQELVMEVIRDEKEQMRQAMMDDMNVVSSPSTSSPGMCGGVTPWCVDCYASKIVYSDGDDKYQRTYEIDDQDNVTLGDPEEVERRTSYVPAPPDKLKQMMRKKLMLKGMRDSADAGD